MAHARFPRKVGHPHLLCTWTQWDQSQAWHGSGQTGKRDVPTTQGCQCGPTPWDLTSPGREGTVVLTAKQTIQYDLKAAKCL